MATTSPLRTHDLEQFRRTFGGDVITPTDAGYDEARRLWNTLHDRRPAVVARVRDVADVATAITFGREQDLEIAVRSGGHAHSGVVGADGGIVVDLTGLRGVSVDAERRTARTDGGALLGDLDVAAQAHGLVCPVGVVGHTGVAGLTLGGGVGRLQRQFGLTIDNLSAVELVTADGRHVRATADADPDLFWGLCGAGWNFGIATAFEFRLRPFGPLLHRGVLAYPASDVHEVWAVFREYARTAPTTVSAILEIDRAGADAGYPDELVGRPIVFISYNHCGAARDVAADTAGLHLGPRPVFTTATSEPYLAVQGAHDLLFAWGHRSFIKGQYVDDVRPEALDEVVELVRVAPGSGSVSLTLLGGAIRDVDEHATAYSGRAAGFEASANTQWDDPALDDANRDWVRRVVDVFEPDATLGSYSNADSDAGPEETRRIHGDAKLPRLAALKRTWDPDNVFHVNHNVLPAPDA